VGVHFGVLYPEGTLEPLALEELYRRFAPVVHARIRRIVGRDGDDLVHELFLRFLNARPEGKKVGPWIFSTSTSLAIDRLRQRARQDAAWEAEVRQEVQGDEDLSVLLARPEILRRVLAELDRETQEVVVLVRFEELTPEEASVALGLSREAIDERLRRFEERAGRLVKTWRA
jgi:RNA polymerase sigma factor (sigma-70 family)